MISDKNYKIYKILSKKNNIILFNALYYGIEASRESYKKLGINRRSFYYSLKELKENSMVTKIDGKYVLTRFGYFIYSIQEKMNMWIEKDKEISELTQLLSNNNGEELSFLLLKDLEEIVGLSNFEPVKVYTEWSSLASDLALLVKAKKSIKIATRYSEPVIVNYLYEAIRNNVKVEAISDKRVVGLRVSTLTFMNSNNTIILLLKEMLKNPNLKMKAAEVPFSFIIVDKEEVGIEIPNSFGENDLLVAFRFKSPTLAGKLNNIFQRLLENSEKDPIYDLILKEVDFK